MVVFAETKGDINVGTTKELPTVISFCSGYGGIERGIELAGVEHRVIAYVEIEAFAIANLVAKMESGQLDPAPIWTDLKTFPAHLFRGAVDIITSGYPCQPFSSAGKRKGADDSRHLWLFTRDHINAIRPDRCFFENVEGHISLGLSTVISDLEEDGYSATWGIFSAREVGAPHQRKRVYILADTSSARSQTWLSGQEHREERDTGKPNNSCNKQDGGKGCSQWSVEPRVGRVVDGCADRVDRIRLLGNGIVPQTAAKAWKILGDRYERS
jgi:DNA (cytosine-5)-methyltransferase 1